MKLPLRSFIPAGALVASGLLRTVGEMVEIVAGQPTPLSGILAALALTGFAIGVIGIWDEACTSLLGWLATIGTVGGALGFVLIAFDSVLLRGTPPAIAIASDPPFLASAAAILVGTAAMALWIIRSPHYQNWVGIVLIATTMTSVLASFLALPPIVQPLSDIAMAASFVQFGLSMYENAKRT